MWVDMIRVGDKVKDKTTGYEGTVTSIWDGKYTQWFYEGEQFNPYWITVRFGLDYITKFGGGILGDGTVTMAIESLEKL